MYNFEKTLFVFGSNLAGIHGAGAALHARKEWGAELGVGKGVTGSSYALPTMDGEIMPLSLKEIELHVRDFCMTAQTHPKWAFLLTPVGCGLGGKEKKDIIPLFKKHGMSSNIFLTSTWVID